MRRIRHVDLKITVIIAVRISLLGYDAERYAVKSRVWSQGLHFEELCPNEIALQKEKGACRKPEIGAVRLGLQLPKPMSKQWAVRQFPKEAQLCCRIMECLNPSEI